jgi:hypothetical protein
MSDLPPWAGSVGAAALTYLLGLHGERDWLDYKRQCNLTSARGVVELAKDANAMAMNGGYILVGADDQGRPTGDVEHQGLFDPAILHDKLSRYLLSTVEIRSAMHLHESQTWVLLYVAPHPDGFCVFTRDGVYEDGGKPVIVFRKGDVFARHGTRSEK